METILIGEITKPQGIKGELKMRLDADGFEAVENLTVCFIGAAEYKITNIRSDGKDAYLTLDGIADRNKAELLRGKEVKAYKNEIAVPSDRYFIEDVIGCNVVLSDGKILGKIENIISGSKDMYYVKTETGGTAMFPLIAALNPLFDMKNKTVTVNADVLAEVVIYEN